MALNNKVFSFVFSFILFFTICVEVSLQQQEQENQPTRTKKITTKKFSTLPPQEETKTKTKTQTKEEEEEELLLESQQHPQPQQEEQETVEQPQPQLEETQPEELHQQGHQHQQRHQEEEHKQQQHQQQEGEGGGEGEGETKPSAEWCHERGFGSMLGCSKCALLERYVPNDPDLVGECRLCCQEDQPHDDRTYPYAKLLIDHHALKALRFYWPEVSEFILRKSDNFPGLDIISSSGATPTLQLVDANGEIQESVGLEHWKMDTIEEFLKARLENGEGKVRGGKSNYVREKLRKLVLG